jgi:hypothetical protein
MKRPYLGLGNRRRPLVIAGDLKADVMNPASWRRSAAVPFAGIPPEILNAKFGAFPSQYLEPNVIAAAGKLRVLATVKPKRQTTANLSAVFDLEDDGTNST